MKSFNYLHPQVIFDAFQSSRIEFIETYKKMFGFSELQLLVVWEGMMEHVHKYSRDHTKLMMMQPDEFTKFKREIFSKGWKETIQMEPKTIEEAEELGEEISEERKLNSLPTTKSKVLYFVEQGLEKRAIHMKLPKVDPYYINELFNIEKKKNES